MANFYKKSQFVRRERQKKAQFGRSMVEMLGVLAIIGVLSVASISGYSKAMAKHQLNQHAEAFNLLLNNAISLQQELYREYGKGGKSVILSGFFKNTSMLPIGMNYNPATDRIMDIFKNQITIAYYLDPGGSTEYYMSIMMGSDGEKISPHNKGVCLNIMMAAQQNAANIYAIDMRSTKDDGGYISGAYLTGGTYRWNDNRKQLATATLNDLSDACNSCNSTKNCNIVVYLSLKYY